MIHIFLNDYIITKTVRIYQIMKIRIATAEDAKLMQEIYAPYVEKTAVTFEYDVPCADDFQHRILHTLEEYPYLAAIEQGKIIGYAYAGPFRSRVAYRHAAEVSIYLNESWHKKGIGRQLYHELENRLIQQNVYVLYACIAVTDRTDDEHVTDASICFHRKMGYKLVGKHNLCGYKFNKWYSVVWMEKSIADRADRPGAFVPFSRLSRQQKMY